MLVRCRCEKQILTFAIWKSRVPINPIKTINPNLDKPEPKREIECYIYTQFSLAKASISILHMQSVFKVALSLSSHLRINREEKYTISMHVRKMI